MFKRIRTVWGIALDRAGLSVASAEHAYSHYGEQFTQWVVVQNWMEGFFEGLAMGLKKLRAGEPVFDPAYEPDVAFKVEGGLLIVETKMPDAAGNVTPVVSTLSYAEAMAAASGLRTLRGTGVFALTDDQAADFIRCADGMLATRLGTYPKRLGDTRPATR